MNLCLSVFKSVEFVISSQLIIVKPDYLEHKKADWEKGQFRKLAPSNGRKSNLPKSSYLWQDGFIRVFVRVVFLRGVFALLFEWNCESFSEFLDLSLFEFCPPRYFVAFLHFNSSSFILFRAQKICETRKIPILRQALKRPES